MLPQEIDTWVNILTVRALFPVYMEIVFTTTNTGVSDGSNDLEIRLYRIAFDETVPSDKTVQTASSAYLPEGTVWQGRNYMGLPVKLLDDLSTVAEVDAFITANPTMFRP